MPRGVRSRALIACAVLALLALPAAAPAKWKPGPERFDVHTERNAAIEMPDGTVIRADVYSPADPESGKLVQDRFPVLINFTPYGKRSLSFLGGGGTPGFGDEASGLARTVPEMVSRGYVNVIADIRGTGRSTGTFGLLDPRQGEDGAKLVRWAAELPNSNGRIGMYGPSYMAMIQYLTAAKLPKRSPLKAMFPIVSGNDVYQEFITGGGMLAGESSIPLFGVYIALPLLGPVIDDGDPASSLEALARNIPSLTEELAPLGAAFLSDTGGAYNGDYWRGRFPAHLLRRVARRRIPTMMAGGWRDVFQRGSLMNYAGLQNRARGRAEWKRMRRGQRPTSRYQVIQGDWTHVTAGRGFPVARTALRWFDTWLKRKPTGLRAQKRPVHLFDITRRQWVDVKRYPFSEAKAKRFFLGQGGSLSRKPPASDEASDPLVFTGVSSPCSGNADQYALGILTLALEATGLENPCVFDDRTLGLGPGAQVYETGPMNVARTLAGPITATIHASSTRPDVSLIATISDVAPDGASRYLTSGALAGSRRAIDRKRSWTDRGKTVVPFHPHTRETTQPVPVGEVVPYEIQVFPTFATLEPGHRLRLTLASVDTPHLTPAPSQLTNMIGGIYAVQRNAGHRSHLTIPMASPGRFKHPCRICS